MKQILVAAILAFSASAFSQVTGAGATFPAPIYSLWAHQYSKSSGVQINYQSVGSGAGIRQITGRTIDFGATDMPLKDEDLEKNALVQFPTLIGGVVPVINIPGIKPGQVRLTGSVLADIYLGKITKWNDKAITSLNPNVKLPDATIAIVRRADGSGTTFLFSNYLSKVSEEWKTKVGEGTSINWPLGAGGKGNEGVAAFLARLPNSIGYLEYSYVKTNKLSHVQLQNAAGTFVNPEEATFKSAASAADWNKSFYQILTNQPQKNAWPITGATFILIPKDPKDKAKAQEALKFLIGLTEMVIKWQVD